MRGRGASDEGLGLVEIVMGMMLLAIIAVTILPALWQGILYSSEQSATATATRELNARIEQVRNSPDCAAVANARATESQTLMGIADDTMIVSGTATACPAGDKKVTLVLVATDGDGKKLATVTAIVYVP